MAGRMILDNVKLLDQATAPTEAGVFQLNGGSIQVFTSAAKNVLMQANTTAFTIGSIPFADTNGNLVQDNSRFFWDASNYRLGILTAGAPATTLDIAAKFQVDANGNIVKINNITYSWPASQAAVSGYVLSNDASGNLTWVAAAGGTVTSVTGTAPITSSGGATPDIKLGAAIAPTTADSNASVIWSPAAANKKALVLQAQPTPTANVLEVQTSAGAVNFAVTAAGNTTLRGVSYTWPAADAQGFLYSNGSGALSWALSPGIHWNDQLDPIGNLALTMAAYTSAFTFNATTGSGVDLFYFTDTASNTGTGYMMNIKTASGSALKPFHVGTNSVDCITALANGRVGIGTSSPGAFALDVGGALNAQGSLTVVGGNLTVTGATDVIASFVQTNGAALNTRTISEEVTIAAAANTDSTTNLLPATSLIIAVSYRVTAASTGPATFDIGVVGDTARYAAALANVLGTTGSSFTLTIPLNPSMQAAASKIRITPNSVPGAADGKIRIVTMYQTITAPTA
jgi:hypothetical protein